MKIGAIIFGTGANTSDRILRDLGSKTARLSVMVFIIFSDPRCFYLSIGFASGL